MTETECVAKGKWSLWERSVKMYPDLKLYERGERVVVDGAELKIVIDNPRAEFVPAFFKDSDDVLLVSPQEMTPLQMQVVGEVSEMCAKMEWELRFGKRE